MNVLRELFLRGIEPFFSASKKEIIEELVRLVLTGSVFVHYETGTPVAFCIVHWPKSALETPQVMHFYSEGSRASSRALVVHILDKVKQKGYNKLRAINGSGVSDDIWTRAFRYKGWEIKPVKTVFEFEVKA